MPRGVVRMARVVRSIDVLEDDGTIAFRCEIYTEKPRAYKVRWWLVKMFQLEVPQYTKTAKRQKCHAMLMELGAGFPVIEKEFRSVALAAASIEESIRKHGPA